ncbi:MAG: hypothetical protein ACXVCM_20580, partial [Ktedonobacteraceae bacterium]
YLQLVDDAKHFEALFHRLFLKLAFSGCSFPVHSKNQEEIPTMSEKPVIGNINAYLKRNITT